jgi:hypothetical protein
MKRSLLVLTPLVGLLLAAGAVAQAGKPVTLDKDRTETIDVKFSGQIDFNWAYQDSTLRDVTGDRFGTGSDSWDIGGSAVGGQAGNRPADFFWGRLTLDIDAAIAEKVHGHIRLETQDIQGGWIQPFGAVDDASSASMGGAFEGQRAMVPYVKRLYVEIDDLWNDSITLTLGMQPVKVDLRDAKVSPGAFVFDISESESAWHGVNRADGGFGVPVTFRDRLHPIGLRFRYNAIESDNVDFNLYVLPIVGSTDPGGDSPNNKESAYIANLDWYIGDDVAQGTKLMVLLAYMNGGNDTAAVGLDGIWGTDGLDGTGSHMNVFTGGLGVDIKGMLDPGLEIFAEAYFQAGDAGVSSATGETLDASGWMVNAGVRWQALDTTGKPWFELSYTHVSGDDSLGDDDYEGFISYEGVNDFAIVESDVLGFDIDTNYHAFKVKAGIGFPSEHSQVDNIQLVAKVGFFRFDESVPSGSPLADDDLGTEIDVGLNYDFNKQLSFRIMVAFLTGADALEAFTEDSEDDTWLMNVGMTLKF